MDEIGVSKPRSLGYVYLKVYNNQIFGVVISGLIMYVILRSNVVFYAIFGICILLLFTGGIGGLSINIYKLNLDNISKKIYVHFFKVPFIKKRRCFLFSEIKVDYTLPKFANKNDEPWLLFLYKNEIIFYINQRNAVGWSREEILLIYNKLSEVMGV